MNHRATLLTCDGKVLFKGRFFPREAGVGEDILRLSDIPPQDYVLGRVVEGARWIETDTGLIPIVAAECCMTNAQPHLLIKRRGLDPVRSA